jgi:pilus assembly protein TadC
MINTLYYYYYLFYKKILKDNEPHMLATLVLSFSFSLLVNGVIDITVAHLFGISLGKYVMLGFLLLIIAVLYFTLHRTGRSKEIVKEKPMFFNSHALSIFITLSFFAITTSFLFWGSGYVGNILGTR